MAYSRGREGRRSTVPVDVRDVGRWIFNSMSILVGRAVGGFGVYLYGAKALGKH